MPTPHRLLWATLSTLAVVSCAPQRQPKDAAQDQEPVTQAGIGFYQEVAWAPDGSALTISIMDAADTPEGFRYRVHRLALDPMKLDTLTAGPMDLWTSWAPDGRRIAFASRVGEASDIFVVRRDGSGRTQLTDDPANDTQPAWSPDGARIAFVSGREGTEQVYVMQSDGSGETRLGMAERNAQNPAWSPDGTRIAYYETDATGNDAIYVMNADGTGRRRLVDGVWPHWSPDGKRILFGAKRGLSIIGVDGTGDSLLIAGAEFGAFAPDGTRIAYIATSDGQVAVCVMEVDGSRSVQLLRREAPAW